MIKAITAGAGLIINDSQTDWPVFYNNSASNNHTLVGQMRYNGSAQCIEVYDGMTWLSIGISYPMVDLAPHVQAVVEWANKKMAEEKRIKDLAETNPALKDAVEALQRAQEQVKIVAALVQE